MSHLPGDPSCAFLGAFVMYLGLVVPFVTLADSPLPLSPEFLLFFLAAWSTFASEGPHAPQPPSCLPSGCSHSCYSPTSPSSKSHLRMWFPSPLGTTLPPGIIKLFES